jgi:ankyrin repeat protein
MHAASEEPGLSVVHLLLGYGPNLEIRDNTGSSALMEAARSGRSVAVQSLVEAGAEIDAADDVRRTFVIFVVFSELKNNFVGRKNSVNACSHV